MKLTGELKDKVDKTESMVEKKDIIAEADMELDDNELEGVVGGRMSQDLYKRIEYCIIHQCADVKNTQILLLALRNFYYTSHEYDENFLRKYFMEYGVDIEKGECNQ